MRRTVLLFACLALLGACGFSRVTGAQPVLTADRAVQMALQYNSQVITANAGVYNARAGVYRAYAGVLPQISASFTRSGSLNSNRPGTIGLGANKFPTPNLQESYSSAPLLSGSWDVLNLSSIEGLRSARTGLQSARFSREAARSDVAFTARQQFYAVVQAAKLVGVQTNALQVARDSERRVRALFEVGSVSRNDVLQAQVQTAQSQLDSIAAVQALLVQRDVLARLIGTEEAKMGAIDTVLTFTPQNYDEGQLLGEAERQRPDLKSAAASVRSAKSGVTSARMMRLPWVSLRGSYTYNPISTGKNTFKTITDSLGNAVSLDPPLETFTRSEAYYQSSASVSLNWNVFDGLLTDAANAQARANLLTAQDAYAVLRRNLSAEVHEAVLSYQQSLASASVAQAADANATESMKLTQQKYNVGSATILDLITAQVALQRAESQLVNALAQIRVAEARINQVRGRIE